MANLALLCWWDKTGTVVFGELNPALLRLVGYPLSSLLLLLVRQTTSSFLSACRFGI